MLQVWNDAALWQGFVKCCALTVPNSAALLFKLPPPILETALQARISPMLPCPFNRPLVSVLYCPSAEHRCRPLRSCAGPPSSTSARTRLHSWATGTSHHAPQFNPALHVFAPLIVRFAQPQIPQ